MTYILLQPTDTIKKGDEWWCKEDRKWHACDSMIYKKSDDDIPRRRLVTPVERVADVLAALVPFAEMADEYARFPGSLTDSALEMVAARFNNHSITRADILKLGKLFDRLSAPIGDGWVPVSEQLPSDCGDVLVFSESDGVVSAFFDTDKNWWVGRDRVCEPTHWRPIPEAPAPF